MKYALRIFWVVFVILVAVTTFAQITPTLRLDTSNKRIEIIYVPAIDTIVHRHIWVEIVKDTINVDWDEIWYSLDRFPEEHKVQRPEYENDISLVCIICFQKKKRVIHNIISKKN